MRTLALGLLAAAGLLFLAPDALAGGWSFEDYLVEKTRSDWQGYGIGTMTHRRVTQTVAKPDLPEPRKTVMEERKTLTEITETEYVIKVETRETGDWQVREERESRGDLLKPTVEDQGAETLTIGGTAYPCAKKKVTWMEGETVKETAVVWTHAEKGVLKVDTTDTRRKTLVVSEFDATWTVGDVTLKGRVFDLVMGMPSGLQFKGTASMSMGIPGNLYHNAFKGAQGPAKIDVLIELLAFTKK